MSNAVLCSHTINSQSELFCFHSQWADLSEIDSITITDLCENNCAACSKQILSELWLRFSQSYEQPFFQ